MDEFNLIYIGWFDNIKRESENNRLLCYNIFNASMNRDKNVPLFDFMPFPWDKKDIKTVTEGNTQSSTQEEFEAMKALVTN